MSKQAEQPIVMTDEDREQLLTLINKYGLPVVIDQAHTATKNISKATQPIRALNLPIRVKNALLRSGVLTIEQAIDIALSPEKQMHVRNWGKFAQAELMAELVRQGYIKYE